MHWVAPNVGYVDNIGQVRCCDCAGEHQREFPIAGDQHFGEDDVCERCGYRLEHVSTAEYVQTAFGFPMPDLLRVAYST